MTVMYLNNPNVTYDYSVDKTNNETIESTLIHAAATIIHTWSNIDRRYVFALSLLVLLCFSFTVYPHFICFTVHSHIVLLAYQT